MGVTSEVRVKRLDGARRIDPWTVEPGARSNELEKLARVSALGLANALSSAPSDHLDKYFCQC
jgi:hypothetical protein